TQGAHVPHAPVALPAPSSLEAEAGAGQVTLRWQPVEGAVGYFVYRSESPGGPFTVLDHGGGDVLAVPSSPYADTTGLPGKSYWYAVAALADAREQPGPLSPAVCAGSLSKAAQPVTVHVQAGVPTGQLQRLWHMLGSEHLSQLLYREGPGGSNIGEEFAAALRLARDELGAQYIRAHAIFHDELAICRPTDSGITYDFSTIAALYDRLLGLGLRPIVELSFMPHALAAKPAETVFTYRGIISPPANWQQWAELNHQFASYLVERYGIEEVSRWGFEVWNEANLRVFWTGSQHDYFKLYELAARAIKSVDPRLLVGGPATAAAEWIGDFLKFVQQEKVPLDFISTHTYGNLPLDFRPLLNAHGLKHVKIWWTEWGVTPTHFAPVNDSAFAAPFVLHGMKRTQGRADLLAYWVISDHFEELGRAPRLFHGGFGLLSIGNLRKPRYWALRLAEELGSQLVQCEVQGDGAGSLVDAWASYKPDGSLDILAWNGTLDQSKITGSALLTRRLQVRIEQLAARRYHASLARVDTLHSNITAHWQAGQDWPTAEQWTTLRAADRLDEVSLPEVVPDDGAASFTFDLPMPGIIRLRLTPQ
ncbi:MAG: hypothetical protein IMW89_21490, partial [Ktedonobacteraceae bacterium]|nr:hypothetical protein [Ktedonobacteraceae bacterium]